MKDIQELVSGSDFFAPLRPERLAVVAGCGRTRAFRPGEMLLREGEPEESFYLVREGAVALEVHAPQRRPLERSTVDNALDNLETASTETASTRLRAESPTARFIRAGVAARVAFGPEAPFSGPKV